jgi:hypothetical protein
MNDDQTAVPSEARFTMVRLMSCCSRFLLPDSSGATAEKSVVQFRLSSMASRAKVDRARTASRYFWAIGRSAG